MVVIGEIHKVDMRRFIPFLISLVIIEGALQWLEVEVGTTFLWWSLNGVIIFFFIYCREYKKYKLPVVANLYLIWVLLSGVRGIFMAEGYWDFKELISNLLFYSLPVCLCFFRKPGNFIGVSRWCLLLLPFYFFILIPFSQPEAVGKILLIIPPFLLFIHRLSLPIKIYLFSALVAVFVLGSLGARSSAVRFAVAFLFSISFIFRRFLYKSFFLMIVYLSIIIIPILFGGLALSGVFNVFSYGDNYKGKYEVKDAYGLEGDDTEDLSADTRTFLYVEVISSALDNNYVIWGHSLSRGYKSLSFGDYDLISRARGERPDCEVALLNVFTHMGVIGFFLYSFIFLSASKNALFNSRSYAMKLVGLWIAFRWLFSWIEEFSRFDINNIYIWAFIAMCYSPIYMDMTDKEFISVINSCFFKKTQKNIRYKRLIVKICTS